MGAHTGALDITGLLGRFRPGPRSKEHLQGEGEGEGERKSETTSSAVLYGAGDHPQEEMHGWQLRNISDADIT